MNISGIEIGSGHPCRVVAELSNAHNGDFDRMLRLMDAAKAAGADILKIQAYTVAELVALRGDGPAPKPWHRYSMSELYSKAQTPLFWLPDLFDHARKIGIPLFSSVFGPESLAALEACGCPAYKIAHLDEENNGLRAMVRATGKPVIVSTADRASLWTGTGAMVLYCPGGYPCDLLDVHMPYFGQSGYDQERVSPFHGLSSHCLDPLVAPTAVARGAKVLEYHFMLAAEPSELEASVSLNEREFSAMVQSVRQAEILLG